jgi:hypothetical protein
MHTGQKKNWHHLNKSSFVGVVCADFSNGFPVSFLSLLLKRMKRRTNVRKNMRSRGFARSWLCPPRRGPFFFTFSVFTPPWLRSTSRSAIPHVGSFSLCPKTAARSRLPPPTSSRRHRTSHGRRRRTTPRNKRIPDDAAHEHLANPAIPPPTLISSPPRCLSVTTV